MSAVTSIQQQPQDLLRDLQIIRNKILDDHLEIPDDVLLGLVELTKQDLARAPSGTIYNIPAMLDRRVGGIAELIEKAEAVFNRTLAPHLPGGFVVQLKVMQ